MHVHAWRPACAARLRLCRAQVTPLLGLLQWLQQALAASGPGRTERVHLVWASQNSEDFGMLPEALLSESQCAPPKS